MSSGLGGSVASSTSSLLSSSPSSSSPSPSPFLSVPGNGSSSSGKKASSSPPPPTTPLNNATSQYDTQVLVVGAGPVGLLTAVNLLQRHVSTRIVEKRRSLTPLNESKSIMLHPRTMEILSQHGLYERLKPYTIATSHATVHDQHNAQLADVLYSSVQVDTAFPSMYIVPQGILERVIYERLVELKGRVEFDMELILIEQSAGDATAHFGDSTFSTHLYIIGCDGADGVVSSFLGNSPNAIPPPQNTPSLSSASLLASSSAYSSSASASASGTLSRKPSSALDPLTNEPLSSSSSSGSGFFSGAFSTPVDQIASGISSWMMPVTTSLPDATFADVLLQAPAIASDAITIYLLPKVLCMFFPMFQVHQEGQNPNALELPPKPSFEAQILDQDQARYFRVVLCSLEDTTGSWVEVSRSTRNTPVSTPALSSASSASSVLNSPAARRAPSASPLVGSTTPPPAVRYSSSSTPPLPPRPQVHYQQQYQHQQPKPALSHLSFPPHVFPSAGPPPPSSSSSSSALGDYELDDIHYGDGIDDDDFDMRDTMPFVTEDEFREAFRQVGEVAGARVDNVVWLTRHVPETRLAERYRLNRVFIGGDAAHSNSIFGGHGLNTGLQDAVNIAWKLSLTLKTRANASLLDTYEEERREVARQMIRNAGMLSQILATRSSTLQSLRNLAMSFSTGFTFVNSGLSQAFTAVRYNYCDTRLTYGPYPAGFALPPITVEMASARGTDCAFQQLISLKEIVVFFHCPGVLRDTDRQWMQLEESAASIRARYKEHLVSFVWVVDDDTACQLAVCMNDGAVYYDKYREMSKLCKAEPMKIFLRPDGMVGAVLAVDSQQDLQYLTRILR